jgi:hypothetical protein
VINTIEILRSILFTKEDLADITNLGDTFSDKDIEFMIEFKKIYELGLGQLKKFLTKLDEEGKDLDTYSILYYVDILNNGPLGSYVREYTKDKKYFNNTPDTLGINGNNNYSPMNIAMIGDQSYSLGCHNDTYNKLPKFIQDGLKTAVSKTEDLFRSCVKSSTVVDNTLPLVDKDAQSRSDLESKGEWVKKSIGSYCVKDSFYYLAIKKINQQIYDKVKEELGEEDFRVFSDKKKYDPFSSEQNESTSTNTKIEKNFIDGEDTQKITLDLLGDVFDSEEKRKSSLKISNVSKDKYYKLNSNEGVLGV